MRSPDYDDDGDLDLRALRRTPARTTPARRGWRRYLIGGVVTAVLGLFVAVVWFAYQDLMPGGDAAPPLIRADAGPLKREPDQRGGLPVVNAESAVVQALDEPDAPVRVERIVPRQSTAPRSTADVVPEIIEAEPVDEPEALVASADAAADAVEEAAVAAEASDGADALEVLIADVTGGVEELREIEPAAGTATAPPQQRRVIPFEPGPTTAAQPEPAAEPSTTTTTTAAESPAPAPVVPAVRPIARAESPPAQRAAATPPAATPAPAPAATQTAALSTPPALAADFTGAYRIQLLAVRDEAAAAGAWANLQARFPGVLGSLRSRVQRADLGDATFFRLQAGPFRDRDGAASVCSALQERGADCFVVEPAS